MENSFLPDAQLAALSVCADSDDGPILFGVILVDVNDTSTQYVIVGASLSSSDGEVRCASMSRQKLLQSAKTQPIADAFAVLSSVLTSRPYFVTYFPSSVPTRDRRQIEDEVMADDVDIIMCTYTTLSNMQARTGWFEKNKNTLAVIQRMPWIMHHMTATPIGHKFVPISAIESEHVMDVRYKLWREILITQLLANISSNGTILPPHSAMRKWFILQEADGRLFANKQMHDKYEASKSAIEILAKVEKLAESGATVNKDIVSLRSVVLSDKVAVLPFFVFVFANRLLDTFFMVDGATTSYVIDVMWNLYVLHKYAGIIHCDMHLGNVLMTHFGKTQTPRYYRIGDKVYESNSSQRGGIIDFSRALINPYRQIFSAESASSIDVIAQEQHALLRAAFTITFERADILWPRIERIFEDDFNRAFRIASVVDVMFFMKALLTFCENDPKLDGALKELRPIYSGVNRVCFHYLEELPQEEYVVQRIFEEVFAPMSDAPPDTAVVYALPQ